MQRWIAYRRPFDTMRKITFSTIAVFLLAGCPNKAEPKEDAKAEKADDEKKADAKDEKADEKKADEKKADEKAK